MKTLVIITGTSRGLGNAIESHLIKNENCYIIAINRTINKEDSLSYKNIKIDLSIQNEKQIFDYRDGIKKVLFSHDFKRIVFINNGFSIAPLNNIHLLDTKQVIESCNTNIISAIILLKEFVLITKDLNIQKDIFNITSGASKYPINEWSIYCLSKAAIEMFMASIKKEYDDIFGIYNFDPGVIDTDMQKTIRQCTNNKDFVDLKTNNLLSSPDSVSLQILDELML